MDFLQELRKVLQNLLPSSRTICPKVSFLPHKTSDILHEPARPLSHTQVMSHRNDAPCLFLREAERSSNVCESSVQNSCLFHEDSGFLHLPMKHRLLMQDKKVRKSLNKSLSDQNILPSIALSVFSLHYKILYLPKEEFLFYYVLCALLYRIQSLLYDIL